MAFGDMVVPFPGAICGGFSACVGKLDAGDGSPSVDFLDDRFEGGGLLVIPQACIGPGDTAFGGDGRGFDDDQPCSTAGQGAVVDLVP